MCTWLVVPTKLLALYHSTLVTFRYLINKPSDKRKLSVVCLVLSNGNCYKHIFLSMFDFKLSILILESLYVRSTFYCKKKLNFTFNVAR